MIVTLEWQISQALFSSCFKYSQLCSSGHSCVDASSPTWKSYFLLASRMSAAIVVAAAHWLYSNVNMATGVNVTPTAVGLRMWSSPLLNGHSLSFITRGSSYNNSFPCRVSIDTCPTLPSPCSCSCLPIYQGRQQVVLGAKQDSQRRASPHAHEKTR